jgi:16S rRNA (guanine966-N2)-methyltransferase
LNQYLHITSTPELAVRLRYWNYNLTMSIRVIGGKAKGRKLKMVPGSGARPIIDRVKENLFNILGSQVQGSRWLDSFAGTGSVGIEALSRGAAFCLFLDIDSRAIRTIHENLAITGLHESAQVSRRDAFAFLGQAPPSDEGFEAIYIAPPQYKDMWTQAIALVDAQPDWLFPDGLAIAQIDPREYRELDLTHLTLVDQRTYGNTMLCFYERPGE